MFLLKCQLNLNPLYEYKGNKKNTNEVANEKEALSNIVIPMSVSSPFAIKKIHKPIIIKVTFKSTTVSKDFLIAV